VCASPGARFSRPSKRLGEEENARRGDRHFRGRVRAHQPRPLLRRTNWWVEATAINAARPWAFISSTALFAASRIGRLALSSPRAPGWRAVSTRRRRPAQSLGSRRRPGPPPAPLDAWLAEAAEADLADALELAPLTAACAARVGE
jgi:hypothetical protein